MTNLKFIIKILVFFSAYIALFFVYPKNRERKPVSNIQVLDIVNLDGQINAGEVLLREIRDNINHIAGVDFVTYHQFIFKKLYEQRHPIAVKRIGLAALVLLFAPHRRLIYVATDLHYKRIGDYDEYFRLLRKLFLAIIKKLEIAIWRRSALIFYNREDEANFIKEFVADSQLCYLPLLTFDFVKFSSYEIESQNINLLFIGSRSNKPNIAAMDFIQNKFIPFLAKQDKRIFNLFIVGKGWDITNAKSNNITIEYLPFVSNHELDEIYSKIDFSIAPLAYGTGLKGKVVESIKHGKLCVGTGAAYDGLNISQDFTPALDRFNSFFEALISSPAMLDGFKDELNVKLEGKFSPQHYQQIVQRLKSL